MIIIICMQLDNPGEGCSGYRRSHVLGDLQIFPSQLGDIIPPVCPGHAIPPSHPLGHTLNSLLGSRPGGIPIRCPDYLSSSGRFFRTPKPLPPSQSIGLVVGETTFQLLVLYAQLLPIGEDLGAD